MTHNRDATFHNSAYLFSYSYATLKLNRLGATLLNKAGGVVQGIGGTDVVGHKWHITDYHRLFCAPDHSFSMV